MIGCDVIDCTVPALVALRVEESPGHTHVCTVHERIDREFAAVTASTRVTAFGCPWCPGGVPGSAVLGAWTPKLLD